MVRRAMDRIDVRPRCQLAYGRLTLVGCLHGQVYEGFKRERDDRTIMTNLDDRDVEGACTCLSDITSHCTLIYF